MNVLARLARKNRLRAVGLMSGTSADGVDVALIELSGRRGVRIEAFATYPYPPKLRRQVLDLAGAETARVDDICRLNFALGEVFADAVVRLADENGTALGAVDLVGSHGQTIRHLPEPSRPAKRRVRSTLQIAEPAVIARRTGITTVADFRPSDIAAGGYGAPLVAYVDWLLLTSRARSRAVQNIGGIANVTYLPPAATLDEVVAFDTGPGNMVVDHLVGRITHGRRRFDRNGRLAARGEVSSPLLKELLRHPYIRRPPPKTCGREQFGAAFSDALYEDALAAGISADDAVATATAFTAETICRAYRRFLPAAPEEVILCGGGGANPTLVSMLHERLGEVKLSHSDEYGLPADAKEAVAFAVLACETIRGRANNAPRATGAAAAVVLGKIVPGGGRPE